MENKVKVELDSPKKVFEALDLKELSVYKVLVKLRSTNPTHVAFLFTGLSNNPSGTIFSGSYDKPHNMMDVFSIKIVRRLCSTDTNKKEISDENNS